MQQVNSPLNVQCFVKKAFFPTLGGNTPRLLYVSKTNPAASIHPRVMHAHEDFLEIILICSGISEYLINDKKQFIRQGDLIVYNSGIVHDEVSGPGAAVGSRCVAIGGVKLEGLRENALLPDDVHPVFPSGDSFDDLQILCDVMFDNLSCAKPGAEEFCHYLMMALIAKTLSIAGGASEETGLVDDPNILGRRIKRYIDQHYMENLSLQSIGDALKISPYYLSHIFKQMSGYSPMQYLLRRRIGEAQTLLITTDYSLTRISEMVGYETQSYFNQQFTKHVGVSPRKYRQTYIVPPAGKR